MERVATLHRYILDADETNALKHVKKHAKDIELPENNGYAAARCVFVTLYCVCALRSAHAYSLFHAYLTSALNQLFVSDIDIYECIPSLLYFVSFVSAFYALVTYVSLEGAPRCFLMI